MRLPLIWIAAGAVALTVAGSAGASPDVLAGTRWQLVSIDNSDGATDVDTPRSYTMAFGADGNAAFRVDCNRGVGSWLATPPAAPSEPGGLSFGPIALTRMACPQPSLDHQVGVMLAAVRAYRLTAGHLALIGDAGTLNWDAVPAL